MQVVRRVSVAGILVFTLGGLAVTPVAFARRHATRGERRAMLALVGNPWPRGWAYRVVWVSTVDSRWAEVEILPMRGHAHQVQQDVGSTYRLRSGRWVMHQAGNGGGCHMPARVRRDLRLACY